jgi:hypothetical protein
MAVIRQGYATLSAFPPTGLANIIYVDLSTGIEYIYTTTYVLFVPTKVIIEEGVKSASWFTANPGFLLGKGQRVNLDTQQGIYKLGDGVTALSALSWLGAVPTKTSELTNDGDDGNPFISLNDLPSNIILYPTNVPSAIPTYFKAVSSIADPDYNVTAVDISTGTITTTAQLISSLSAPIGLIVGNPGIFNITTIGNIKRVSGTGTATFYFEVYKRTALGTETLIGTSSNTLAPTLSTYVEFSETAIWNDGIFAPTDLPVYKFYANRVYGGSDPVYNFQFGGTTPVRTLVPVPLSVTSSGNELLVNKQNSLAVDGTGGKYPTVDAIRLQLGLNGSVNIPNYYNMKMLKNNAITPWRDGPMMQKVNSKIRFFGGWNPAGGVNFTPSTDEQYESTDGITWTKLTDFPMNPAHFALNCGAWLGYQAWMFGGDPLYGVDIKKVYACDSVGTWQLLANDWGLSGLSMASGCLHNNEFFVVGGIERSTLVSNMNVYKTVNGTSFTTVSTFSNSMSTGKLYSFNGYLYFMGGASFTTLSAPSTGYNNKVYRSRDGVAWELVSALTQPFESAWNDGQVWDNKLWMIAGYGPPTLANKQAIYYTDDCITWTQLTDVFGNPTTQPATHAPGTLTYNNALHIVGGNNDPLVSYKIERVDLTYYNSLPKGCDLILQMCDGVYTDGTPWKGTKCGQVATLNGFDTFEVGFIGGTGANRFDIDVAAVQTWAAGRDFYWSIIYDRSGNNNHAYNIVGNRPQAGISGVMTLRNGKPSCHMVNGTKTLLLTNQINLGTSYLMSAILTFTASGYEFIGSGSANKYGFYNLIGGSMYHQPGSGGYECKTPFVLNSQYLFDWYRDGANIQGYQNGTRLIDSTLTVANSFVVNDLMGESSTYGFRGYFQGLVLKAGVPTLSERYSIQTFLKTYYNII